MNVLIQRILIFSSLFLVVCSNLNAQQNECDYFGLTVPRQQPMDFNPAILDLDGSFKFNVEIRKCDVIYFTTIDSRENIYWSTKQNGKWSKPKMATFSDPNYSDADPFLNKEGNKIYFISERPTHAEDQQRDWNIWYANKEKGGWSAPIVLPAPINTNESNEYFFSISDKGNAFFSSNRAGGEGSYDIYTVKVLGNNEFSTPRNIGRPISTEKYEFDPYISPDERYMIFSINENGNSSLHFSYKDQKEQWTEPKILGDRINLTRQDFAPSFSADGRFMFYSNNGKLKWVSTDVLNLPRTK